ncbi:RHS repeat-associated core domain-containing protein [Mycolicibacterium boenickei]
MSNDHPPAEPTDCPDCSEGPKLLRNVRLATGEFVWQQEDLRVAGRGLDFVWTRTYRSRPEAPDKHWDHAYALRAEATRGGIRVWTGTGGADTYRLGTGGIYTARGVFAEGRLGRAREFRLRFSGGGVWEFRPLDGGSAAGCIARIVDRNGNALRFGYDEAGRLVSVTDTLGRDFRLTHDRAGRLTALTDFTGRRVSYSYTADGDLASVTYPPVTGTVTGNDFPRGATVTYSYSAPHRLVGITDRAGEPLLGIEYGESFDHERVSALHWATAANPVHITYHPTDEATILAIVNDASGNVRDLLFDKHDACVGVREYTAPADAGKPTTRTENRPGRPVHAGDPPFYETRYDYDNPDGLLTRTVRPDGGTTVKEFEIARRADASPIERGNLRSIRYTPGESGADQPELVRTYDYLAGFGCTCGQAFVSRETDPRGAVCTTEYDDRGNPVLIVEPDGSRTELSYNTFGDVVARVQGGIRDTFEYSDRHGQLSAETLDADGLAQRTTYEHDALGRLTLLRDPAGHEHRHDWNDWDLIVRRTLPDGSLDDTRYDVNHNPVVRVVAEAGRKRVQTRTYDRLGRLLSVSRPSRAGHEVIRSFEYDGNGNRVGGRHGDERVERVVFDALDRPVRHTRGQPGKGYRELTYDYDAVGHVVRVTRGAGADASTTRYDYDGYGRVATVTAPNGMTVSYSRDGGGNVLRQTVRRAGDTKPVAEVTQTFDAAGRLTMRTTTGADTGESAVEHWEFDDRSRLVRRVDAAGAEQRTRYDGLDRPVEVDDGAGRVTTYSYDGNSNVAEEVSVHRASGRRLHTRYVRDARGRVLEVVAPQGMSRRFDYDAFDRPGTIGLPDHEQVGLEYDGLGRPTQVRWSGRDGSVDAAVAQSWSDGSRLLSRSDPHGNATRYTHDAAGDIVEIRHPDASTEAFSFDSVGNCVGWTDPNGTRVVNTYDSLDRLVRRDITPGDGVADDTTSETYTYDELGRLVRAANDRHTVEWGYDGMSRVVRQVQDGREIVAGHDGSGRRTSVRYPSGYRLEFDYEGTDLRRISDRRGVAVEVDPAGITRFVRTPASSTATWDSAGLPDRLLTTNRVGTVDERRYRWDEAGRLIGVGITDSQGRRDISYTLDTLGRLRSSASSDGRRVDYELDPAGNRTLVRVDGVEGRYTTDRVTYRYAATPADRRTYDANGNLLTVTDERGHTKSMRYDYRNRMVEYAEPAAGLVATYGYDCLGRRLLKTVTTPDRKVEVAYAFDGDVIVEERSGDATRSLIRHGRSVYGMVSGASERWFVSDLVGSVIAELDESGTLARSHDYGDFGEVSEKSETDAPPVSFAGYTYDSESGLYYVRNRYLEPGAGRFTTPDPAGAWEDGRNRGNAYTYAGNNPVMFADPTGLSTYRWHACGGPWPGPRAVKVEYEFCSKGQRDAMARPVCRAFRASGQAQERVFNLVMNDMTGVPMPGASTTRSQVTKWFGGPDNATSLNSKVEIYSTLDDAFDAITSDDFDIDCEGTDGNCDEASAYVVGPLGYDINLCDSFFSNSLFTTSIKAAILIHELTHAYNDTWDYFYYQLDGSLLPVQFLIAFIETPVLRENADNYRMFTQDFFMP